MRMTLSVAIGLAGLALGAAPADDRERPKDSATEVQGTVKRIDVETCILTIATSEGRQQQFQLTDETRFIVAGAPGERNRDRPGQGLKQWMSRLAEGTQLTLRLDSDTSPPTAREVHIRDRG